MSKIISLDRRGGYPENLLASLGMYNVVACIDDGNREEMTNKLEESIKPLIDNRTFEMILCYFKKNEKLETMSQLYNVAQNTVSRHIKKSLYNCTITRNYYNIYASLGITCRINKDTDIEILNLPMNIIRPLKRAGLTTLKELYEFIMRFEYGRKSWWEKVRCIGKNNGEIAEKELKRFIEEHHIEM